MLLGPGDKIDRYSIIALLGTGGMSEVYRAYDPRLQRNVALKVLQRGDPESEAREEQARMLREARAAAALEHSNVVAVYDVAEASAPESLRGTNYIAMELVEGKAMRAYVGDATVPLDLRIGWLRDVARALGAAHKKGLIHRDVKPSNLMVREDGVIKVLDFGIAKRAQAPADPNASTQGSVVASVTHGQLVGTPSYMAPEQLRGEALDSRVDQFSWGVTAYELLAGRKPWISQDGGLHLFAEILSRDPEPLGAVATGVPARVSDAVTRALAKARDLRFASMEELLGAIEPAPARETTTPAVAPRRSSIPDMAPSKRKLLLELGRGGMGTVYLALQSGPGGFSKLKVLKYLNPEYADDPRLLAMFLEEARLAARLRHPNIVQTNEVGVDDGHYFIEMEYLEGQSLRALRRENAAVSLPMSAWILTRVLAALHHAHELRDPRGEPLHIVHRDVSPDNVMLTYDGEVKLVDFGIAKASDSQLRTGTGVVKGKVTYLAPEQAKTGRIDRRVDVFAVGVMLWEAIAGRRFWEGLETMQIFADLQSGKLPSLADAAPQAPRALLGACQRALAPNAQERFATAADLEAVLEGYLEETSARAGPRQLKELLASAFGTRRAAVQAQIDAQLAEASRATPPLHAVPVLEPAVPQIAVQSESPETKAEGRGRWESSMKTPPRPGPKPLGAGSQVGRYVIDGLLGSGGMGEVYRAHDPRLKRAIALKILHVERASDAKASSPVADAAARMLHEAQLAASLDHPNVVGVFDVGQIEEPPDLRGTTYLAMELIRGESLRRYVGDATVKMTTRVRWLEDIARALAAAHAAGLVHRDIKPENVMIREDGIVKVLDFGVAKRTIAAPIDPTSSTEGLAALTMTAQGVVVGTPLYMAPEQLRAEPLDGRADQFAWGVLAYELLTGKTLWSLEGGGFSLVAQILQTPPPSMSAFTDVPPTVAAAVTRALAKDPAARFPTMSALIAQMRSASAAPEPDGAPPNRGFGEPPLPLDTKRSELAAAPSPPTPLAPRARRSAVPIAAATVLLAAAGAALGIRSRSAPVLHTASAASGGADSGAAGPGATGGCVSNAECRRAQNGEPYICRRDDGTCAPLESEDCKVKADAQALDADDTVWIGTMYPLKGALAKAFGIQETEGVELARRDFTEILGGFDARSAGRVRPIGLITCDDSIDATRAARHLADDVRVSAVIGFGKNAEAVALAESVFVPKLILVVSAINSSPMITSIPSPSGQPRLVWRTMFSSTQTARPLAAFVAAALEPRIRAAQGGSRAPIRVALLRIKTMTEFAFADALQSTLTFNGKTAPLNGLGFRDVVVDDPFAPGGKPAYEAAVSDLLAFAPDIVLSATTDALTKEVIVPLEERWPRGSRHPLYASASSISRDLFPMIGNNPERRRRFFGLTNVSTTANNVRLAAHFNETFPEKVTRTTTPNSSYDAFYMLAYASVALDGRPVTGPSLSRSFARLAPPGKPTDVGPLAILDGYSVLAGGANIDLEGTIGHLDLDPATGEGPIDMAVLCVDVDRHGTAVDAIESGLVYDARASAFKGEMRCP